MNGSKKRSRSTSYSSDSISTISTNLSHSPPRNLPDDRHTGQSQLLSKLEVSRKRRRSRSTSMSYTSDSSHGRDGRGHSGDNNGDSHRQRVPKGRGVGPGKRRYSRSRSVSYTSESSSGERRRKHSLSTDRSKRRRHSSRSPIDRGRDRIGFSKIGSRRTRSPTKSRDRGEITRNRKSMTPNVSRQDDSSRRQEPRPAFGRSNSYSRDNDRYGSGARNRNPGDLQYPRAQVPRSERSLSPFSKRLALTQAMNTGR